MKDLSTTDDVIVALGGTSAVSRVLAVSPRAVSNWRGLSFPSKTLVALQDALSAAGCWAPASLRQMVEPVGSPHPVE